MFSPQNIFITLSFYDHLKWLIPMFGVASPYVWKSQPFLIYDFNFLVNPEWKDL